MLGQREATLPSRGVCPLWSAVGAHTQPKDSGWALQLKVKQTLWCNSCSSFPGDQAEARLQLRPPSCLAPIHALSCFPYFPSENNFSKSHFHKNPGNLI